MYCMLPNAPTQIYTYYYAGVNLLGPKGHAESGMWAPDLVDITAAKILP